MTFLQPWMLWALPLVVLPVLIHLFNRMRHRTVAWGAMMFLRQATRKSTRYSRLKQWLILALRCLAVAALLLAVARPLAGGWLGGWFAGAPDVILVVLDRSVSMETRAAGASATRREDALRLIAESAKGLAETSRLLLLESTRRVPQELNAATPLAEVSLAGPSDTSADLPAMVQAALDWLLANRPGRAEIWIASDLQRSNWRPDSDRWGSLAAGLGALPQTVRVRLLALNRPAESGAAVTVVEALRRVRGGVPELELGLDLETVNLTSPTLPLQVVINGERRQLELKLDGASVRHRLRLPLPASDSGGWGFVELPADANLRDNRSFFVYGVQPRLRAALVVNDPRTRRVLSVAIAPDPRGTNTSAEAIGPAQVPTANWADYAVVFWQAPPPTGDVAVRLQNYVETGGSVVYLPPGTGGGVWGEPQVAPVDKVFPMGKWDEQDGPLARTEEGLSLPLADLQTIQRQPVTGEPVVAGAYADGTAFLTRRNVGRGHIWHLTTLPNEQWSDLADGGVLLPLVQRLLQQGGRRQGDVGQLVCGEITGTEAEGNWVPVDVNTPRDFRVNAGVYRQDARLVAVNRPAREDDREVLEGARARQLFQGVSFQMFDEQRQGEASLQSELWRVFLASMALFLLAEGLLILPDPEAVRRTGPRPGRAGSTPAPTGQPA